MIIHPVGTELFSVNGYTDGMAKLIAAMGIFAENCLKEIISVYKINRLLRVKENVFTARYELEL
jgi:hypothetical protein